MSHKLKTINRLLLTLALLGLTAYAAQAQSMLHARVSYDSGGLLVQGKDDSSDWAHSTLNTLVLPGDTLWVDQAGLGEVEFAGGTFLRLADGSKVEVVTMDPTPSVRGWTGSFYIQRLSRSSGAFVVKTPVSTLEVFENTAVRIDILGNGATTVTVRWGNVTVRGISGSGVNTGTGQRVWIDPGLMPSDPQGFDRNQVDEFDEWNQERAAILAGDANTTPKEVYADAPAPATIIGSTSLAGNGKWINVDSTYYWQPTVVDYIPYRNGYWNYVPNCGHVWVGAEPFSYYTTHYGYWDYNPRYGWLWSYTGNWQPAYVTAVHCNGYYMWSPITRNHYPTIVTDSFNFKIGGVNFSLMATSYVSDSYLYSPYHISGMTHDLADNFYHNNGDVNIWNININNSFNNNNTSGNHNTAATRNPIYVPYDDAVQQRVRDYNPSRSIRGMAKLDEKSAPATDRVRTLEQKQGRTSFDVKPSTSGGAMVRTAIDDTNRAASVRKVRLDEGATIMTTPRAGAAGTRKSNTSISSPPTTTTPGASTRPTGQTRVPTLDTPPSTSNPSGSRSRTSSIPDTLPTPSTRSKTSIPDAPASSNPSGGRTRTSVPDSSSTPSTRSKTSIPDAPVSSNPSGGRTRTSIPDASPTPSTKTRSTVPSTESTPSTRTRISVPDSTPAPTTSPKSTTRGDYTPTPRSIPQSSPAPKRNNRVEPTYTPAPEPKRQSAPAPTYKAPQRQSAPAPTFNAPQRQSAPAPSSRDFNPPQSRGSDARSFSAPSTTSRGGSNSTDSGGSLSGNTRSTANNARGKNR